MGKTLEGVTNQAVINLIAGLEGDKTLSGKEVALLKDLTILDSSADITGEKRAEKFSGDAGKIVNSDVFEKFLQVLKEKRPDLFKEYENFTKERKETVGTSRSAQEALAEEKQEHKIVSGDTLTSIAKKFNTTVENLLDLNPKIKDKNKIFAGDTIVVAKSLPTVDGYRPGAAEDLDRREALSFEKTYPTEDAAEAILDEAGAYKLAVSAGEPEAAQKAHKELRAAIMGNAETPDYSIAESFLRNKKATLPKWLKGGEQKVSNKDWAALLKYAEQSDTRVKRLTEIIDDQPLGWYPADLRAAARQAGRGRLDTLTFNEITLYEFGEKEKEFFKTMTEFKDRIAELRDNLLPELETSKASKIEALKKDVTENHLELVHYLELPEGSMLAELGEKGLSDKVREIYALDFQTLTYKEELYEKTTDLETREKVVTQSYQIFIAFEDIVQGEIVEENNYNLLLEHNPGTTKEPIQNPTELYDIDDLLNGETVLATGSEGIGTTQEVIDTIRNTFAEMGVRPAHLNKIDAEFALRLINACYGLEGSIMNGNIQKGPDGGLYFTRLDINSVFNLFHAGNDKLQAVANSLKIKKGRLEFGINATNNYRISQYIFFENQEMYARELARAAFTNSEVISMEDIEAGERLAYRKTAQTLLSTERDAEAALEDLLTYRRVFAPGESPDLNEEEILKDLQHFLETGLENYFSDSNNDAISVLNTAGINIADIKQEIEKLDREIKKTSNRKSRVEQRIKEVTATIDRRKDKGRNTELYEERKTNLNLELQELTNSLQDLHDSRTQTLERPLKELRAEFKLDRDKMDLVQLSPLQIIFIQNGYELSKGRQSKDRIKEETETELEKTRIIEMYSSNEMVSLVFENYSILEIMQTLTPSDLIETAKRVEKMEEIAGMIIYSGLSAEEAIKSDPAASRYMFTAAGAVDNQMGGGRGGVAIPLGMELPGDGVTVNLMIAPAVGGGYTEEGGLEGGIGIGGGATVNMDNGFILTMGMNVGAGFRGPQGYIGYSASVGVGYEHGGFGVVGAVHGAPGVMGWTPGGTLGVSWVDMERFRDRKKSEALGRSGSFLIETPYMSIKEKIEVIESLPAFKSIAEDLKNSEEITDLLYQKILWDIFTQHSRLTENKSIAELDPPPITGLTLTVVPFPPFFVPFIKFAFAGRPQIYFATPEDPNALFTESNISVQAEIAKYLSGAEAVGVEDSSILEKTHEFSQIVHNAEGMPMLTGRSEMSIGFEDLLTENLSSYNQELNLDGINLAPGEGAEEGLLSLDFYDLRGNVDIRMDQDMNARLIPSEDGQRLSIAYNQLNASENLIITREEFILPHKKGGEYRYTRIFIKSDPNPERNFMQAEEVQTDMLTWRDGSGFKEFQGKYDDGKILNQGEYLGQKESLANQGLTTHRLSEFQRQFQEMSERFMRSTETAPTFRKGLGDFAVDFYKKNQSDCLNDTLFDDNMGADYADLIGKIDAQFTGDPALTDMEREYVLSIIRKQTYVSNEGMSPEQRERRYTRNLELFRRVLTDQFGGDAADEMLRLIENSGESSIIELEPGAEVFTVVSRKGAEGMRFNTFSTEEHIVLLRAVELIDNPELQQLIVEKLRPIPSDDLEFMRSSIAVHTFEMYYLLKSPKAAMLMMDIYENPSLLNNLTYKQEFDRFRALAEKLRDSEKKGGEPIDITTDYGATFKVVVNPKIALGRLEYCDNPTVMIDEKIGIVMERGIVTSALEVTLQELPGEIRKEIYEFSLGGGVNPGEEEEVPDYREGKRVTPSQDTEGDAATSDESGNTGSAGSAFD